MGPTYLRYLRVKRSLNKPFNVLSSPFFTYHLSNSPSAFWKHSKGSSAMHLSSSFCFSDNTDLLLPFFEEFWKPVLPSCLEMVYWICRCTQGHATIIVIIRIRTRLVENFTHVADAVASFPVPLVQNDSRSPSIRPAAPFFCSQRTCL